MSGTRTPQVSDAVPAILGGARAQIRFRTSGHSPAAQQSYNTATSREYPPTRRARNVGNPSPAAKGAEVDMLFSAEQGNNHRDVTSVVLAFGVQHQAVAAQA